MAINFQFLVYLMLSDSIISSVLSKTSSRCRHMADNSKSFVASSHSSRHFCNLSTNEESSVKPFFSYYAEAMFPEKMKWKQAEKALLMDAVKRYEHLNVSAALGDSGHINWEEVAELVPPKSPIECFIMYNNVFDPKINRSSWSREEEARLLELVSQFHGHDFVSISKQLNSNRTPIQCLTHYQQALNPNLINQAEWSKEEINNLVDAVQYFGTRWQHVADTLPGRTANQCFIRYRRWDLGSKGDGGTGTLSKRKGRWTQEEERLLFIVCLTFKAPFNKNNNKKSDAEIRDAILHDEFPLDESPEVDTVPAGRTNSKKRTKTYFKGSTAGTHLGALSAKHLWSEIAEYVPCR